ncbi:hypothetical protein HYY69_04130 [Candidatus Woesearchaeota archaeon]|nr:hypothetical protein [Candidatus Woesearchaeota archaeon]
MKLPSKVQFADDKIKKAFDDLEKSDNYDIELRKYLERAFNDITTNAFCGIQIPKKLIPKEYIQKYNVTNAWKYNLPGAWRLIYSIESKEVIVLSIILEWMDHKNYERRFNY